MTQDNEDIVSTTTSVSDLTTSKTTEEVDSKESSYLGRGYTRSSEKIGLSRITSRKTESSSAKTNDLAETPKSKQDSLKSRQSEISTNKSSSFSRFSRSDTSKSIKGSTVSSTSSKFENSETGNS